MALSLQLGTTLYGNPCGKSDETARSNRLGTDGTAVSMTRSSAHHDLPGAELSIDCLCFILSSSSFCVLQNGIPASQDCPDLDIAGAGHTCAFDLDSCLPLAMLMSTSSHRWDAASTGSTRGRSPLDVVDDVAACDRFTVRSAELRPRISANLVLIFHRLARRLSRTTLSLRSHLTWLTPEEVWKLLIVPQRSPIAVLLEDRVILDRWQKRDSGGKLHRCLRITKTTPITVHTS